MICPAHLILAAAAAAGGLRVETATPDALCPDIGQVRDGVRARLGEIEGPGEWVASVALVHRPDAGAGDVVRLELRDPAGRLRLRRELPRAGESCKAVGQAVVLLLDAYFRHPSDEADVDTDAGAEGARAVGANRAPAVTAAAPPPAPAASPAPAPAAVGGAIDLLAGWAGGPSSPALGIGVGVGIGPRWAAGLDGAWLTAAQDQAVNVPGAVGSATMHSMALRIYVARRVRIARRAELAAGPEALLALDRAVTSSALGGESNVRAAGGPGLHGQLRLRISEAVSLSIVGAADFTPRAWAGSFGLAGSTMELFAPPRVRFYAGVGVGVCLFP
jgi:hypothetical protein